MRLLIKYSLSDCGNCGWYKWNDWDANGESNQPVNEWSIHHLDEAPFHNIVTTHLLQQNTIKQMHDSQWKWERCSTCKSDTIRGMTPLNASSCYLVSWWILMLQHYCSTWWSLSFVSTIKDRNRCTMQEIIILADWLRWLMVFAIKDKRHEDRPRTIFNRIKAFEVSNQLLESQNSNKEVANSIHPFKCSWWYLR